MLENIMHHIGGVAVFGIISVAMFFLFFAGVLIWAACLKTQYLNSMQDLPLSDETPNADTPHGTRNTHHDL